MRQFNKFSAVMLSLLFVLSALSACGADEPSSSAPPQEPAQVVESVVETPEISTPEVEGVIEEASEMEPEPIDEYIPQYTTTSASEDAFIQLVRDTITITRDRLAAEQITPTESEYARLGEWLFVHDGTPFANYECVNIPYLTHFLSYGLFDADIEELEGWNLLEPSERQVFNAYFDVNYTMEFDYQDTTYQALIGNWQGDYIVLDMIVEGDIDLTPQPTPTPEPQQPTSNVSTTPAPQAPSGGGTSGYNPNPTPAPESTPSGGPGYVGAPPPADLPWAHGGGIDITEEVAGDYIPPDAY